jgi:hypothetical protein
MDLKKNIIASMSVQEKITEKKKKKKKKKKVSSVSDAHTILHV